MSTNEQLHLLGSARQRYADGTFKVMQRPFYQLSIHEFMKSEDFTKQAPLVFALMSGKCQGDYEEVFQAIKELLSPDPEVEVIMDFEVAMWISVKECVSFCSIA